MPQFRRQAYRCSQRIRPTLPRSPLCFPGSPRSGPPASCSSDLKSPRVTLHAPVPPAGLPLLSANTPDPPTLAALLPWIAPFWAAGVLFFRSQSTARISPCPSSTGRPTAALSEYARPSHARRSASLDRPVLGRRRPVL